MSFAIGDIFAPEPGDPAPGRTARLLVVVHAADDRVLAAEILDHDPGEDPGSYAVAVGDQDLDAGCLGAPMVVRTDLIHTICTPTGPPVARLGTRKLDETLRRLMALTVHSHCKALHRAPAFVAGRSQVACAGRVYDHREMTALAGTALDFWLTAGPHCRRFEQRLADFIGVRHCLMTNSGSSANLLAVMALTSANLGKRRIRPGDEVITVAAGFPTTVAPIVQCGAVPVFVDIELPTYNIDCSRLESAVSAKTKAVMLAHTLGNPFDVARVVDFCRANGLWLIEDCCDALGSRWTGPVPSRPDGGRCGSFGDLATFSFYPAHHITTGEGGAVACNDDQLQRLVASFRDWGRDCWCAPGKDNSCGKRFGHQMGRLPLGYDHKYIYSHLGYNLKATEMQGAIGWVQMEKLPDFIAIRRRNWQWLREGLDNLNDVLILPAPTKDSDPSWFGFTVTVKPQAGIGRDSLVAHLEACRVQTRMLFCGNILHHPCFDELIAAGRGYRVAGTLETTDTVMRDTFWVGVYPGLDRDMLAWVIEQVHKAVGRHRSVG